MSCYLGNFEFVVDTKIKSNWKVMYLFQAQVDDEGWVVMEAEFDMCVEAAHQECRIDWVEQLVQHIACYFHLITKTLQNIYQSFGIFLYRFWINNLEWFFFVFLKYSNKFRIWFLSIKIFIYLKKLEIKVFMY